MALAAALVTGLAVLVLPFRWPFDLDSLPVADRAQAASAPQVRPTAKTRPRYLTRSYRAPSDLVRPGAGGTLRIPSLRIRSPVDAVGLDGSAMAVPNDPARVGWLSRTAKVTDLLGSSVLAGHVSDRHDRPGALSRLKAIKVGATIIWLDRSRRAHRYEVVGFRRYSRSGGLPASLFQTDGPHLLHLVTCTDRRKTASGGFHYAANLVVTARERTHQTGRGTSD